MLRILTLLAALTITAAALTGLGFAGGPKADDDDDDCSEETEVSEDDGAQEDEFANTFGVFPLLNCLTPPSYPSYLTEVSAYLTTNTIEMAPIQWVIYTGPDATSEPGELVFVSAPVDPTQDDWNVFETYNDVEFETAIDSGVWCVGFMADNTGGSTTRVGADDSANDGHGWTILETAGEWKNTKDDIGATYNLMIRMKVNDCPAEPPADDDTDDDTGDDDSDDDDTADDDAGGDDDAAGDDDADDDDDDDDDASSLSGSGESDDGGGGCCG